ncbi:putative ATP phosphoribosyltransferase [Rosa chinensis]|uniref:Putative ATP phosphoribosyltransferase n=1 Tax=Rosa chinensis TaxID=74649 RepID=A0A2P6S8Z7_ROSCH|nr:putative ATP phosphoribosyltransferase [Rosa chinensis]
MAADTLDLLKDCQFSIKQVNNPHQYVAKIPELSNLEVWFQRPKDIVKKLLSRDLDLGIAGLDTVSEYVRVLTMHYLLFFLFILVFVLGSRVIYL